MQSRSILSLSLSLATLALFGASAAASVTPAQPLGVDEALGLSASRRVQVTLLGEVGQDVTALLNVDGVALTLPLRPVSVRAAGFQVLVKGEAGAEIAWPAGPVRTLRGVVPELPGSQVAASWSEGGGLEARLRLPDGLGGVEDWWLQPVPAGVAGAAAGEHVLYRNDDVLAPQRLCAAADYAITTGAQAGTARATGGMLAASGAVAELACDSDVEYFRTWGSASAVQARIESVINTMNLQYESEVGITHQIVTVVVRTSSGPYKGKDASKLLNAVRSEWLNNFGGVQRDAVQFFTGKVIAGSTIGIAWLGTVCNTNLHYSLVQSDFNGNFASATDLSAHELGHNWSADHCSCTSNTMNPYITTANTFHPSFTVPEIVSYRDNQSCLGASEPPPPPADPTSVHVGSIATGTQGAGKGSKYGTATVTIVDDTGAAVAGASVSGAFSGTWSDGVSGTTNAQGQVTFTTSGSAKGGVSVGFCVTGVVAGLPYAPGDNAVTCN